MPIELQHKYIGNTKTAHEDFGSTPGLLVGVPSSSIIRPYITIPSGYYALVTSFGSQLRDKTGSTVWPAGIYFVPPWVSVSHLVTKGYSVFDTPCKGCKTKDNVTVQIDLDCVFRIMGDASLGENPDLVAKFVHEVTPRGLQQQLSDAMDEAVRTLARSLKHKDVYGLRSVSQTSISTVDTDGKFQGAGGASAAKTVGFQPMNISQAGDDEGKEEGSYDPNEVHVVGAADEADEKHVEKAVLSGESAAAHVINSLNKQFMPQGVQITDVMITNVELPQEIVNQLTNKTMVISSNAQEVMTQQYQMQDLRFTEELKKAEQTYDEQRRQEHQDAAYARSEAKVRLENLKAEAQKQVDLIRQQNTVEVKSINANADLEVTKLVQEKNRIQMELRTKSEAAAAELKADSELYCYQKLSEARLQVEKNKAKAVELLGNAEGTVAPLLEAFNAHAINLEKMSVFESLARNGDAILAPTGSQDLETLALVDHILHDSAASGTGSATRSEMLGELMLMRAGGQVALNTQSGAAIMSTAGAGAGAGHHH